MDMANNMARDIVTIFIKLAVVTHPKVENFLT
jgi:hypothetical protein